MKDLYIYEVYQFFNGIRDKRSYDTYDRVVEWEEADAADVEVSAVPVVQLYDQVVLGQVQALGIDKSIISRFLFMYIYMYISIYKYAVTQMPFCNVLVIY